MKGFGSEAAPALGALNAELIGSVLVAAEGAAAGLGKLTEEFPNVLPPKPDDPVEPVGADGLETLEEGVAEGLGNPAEGAGFFSGSGALNAEFIGCAGSALGAALAGVVVGLAKPPALGKPAEGAGFF